MRSINKKLLLTLALGAAFSASSGCVYRMNIQQGNFLEARTVNQLQVGMTRSQVRYLLGTPMVPDAFDKERWDYLYFFKKGRFRQRAGRRPRRSTSFRLFEQRLRPRETLAPWVYFPPDLRCFCTLARRRSRG